MIGGAEERQLPPPVILIPTNCFSTFTYRSNTGLERSRFKNTPSLSFLLFSHRSKILYIYIEYHWCCSTTLSSSPCFAFSRESERKRCLLQVGDPRDQEGLEALVAALLFFAVVFAGPCLHVSISCAVAAS
ncbi:unnamed protein product, partial [Vitis vinifera]